MSKTFRNFLYELRYVFPKYLQFIISGVGLGGHALYSYGTYNTSTIQIQKMYKYTQTSNTQFMIIDKNGKHYNLNNSFWYWKWDSIEDWHTLRENDLIKIKYYGYRVPFLGFFPNIICSKNGVTENMKTDPPKNNDYDDNDDYDFILIRNQSYV